MTNVLITEERSPLEPESGHKRKYYAPGVGNVRVDAVGDPEDETLVLAEVSQLSPEDLEKVRQEALKLEKTAYEVSACIRQTSPTRPSLHPNRPSRRAPADPKEADHQDRQRADRRQRRPRTAAVRGSELAG